LSHTRGISLSACVTGSEPCPRWIRDERCYKRALNEIHAKGKFDAPSLRVLEDGAITAGSFPQKKVLTHEPG
jgi:hypothetical protein